MDPKTRQFLTAADANREFAAVVANAFAGAHPSLEWAAVIAFYAAIHYVNAYLWEVARLEPSNRAERTRLLTTLQPLQPTAASYERLRIFGYRARYAPGFRMLVSDLQQLINTDLAAIEAHIRSLLPTPEQESEPET